MRFLILLFIIFTVSSFDTYWCQDSLRLIIPVGHSDEIISAQFLQNEKFIITHSFDNTVKIYETISEKEIWTHKRLKSNVTIVSVSPNNLYYAIGYSDSTVEIFDAKTTKLIHSISGIIGKVKNVIFNPNDRQVILISIDEVNYIEQIKIIELKSWNTLYDLSEKINVLNGCNSISLNGRFLACGRQELVKLIDLNLGSISKVITPNDTQISNNVQNIFFSSDSKNIIISYHKNESNEDYRLTKESRIVDVDFGKDKACILRLKNEVSFVLTSPDGNYFLTVGMICKIYDAHTWNELYTLNLSENNLPIWDAQFSSDSKYFAISINDEVKIYESISGNLFNVIRVSDNTVSPNEINFGSNKSIIISSGPEVKLFNFKSGKIIKTFSGKSQKTHSPQFVLDASIYLFATENNMISAINTNTGELINNFQMPQEDPLTGYKVDIYYSISSNGKNILAYTNDGTTKVFSILSGQELYSNFNENSVIPISQNSFGEDGNSIAMASSHMDSVHIIDILSNKIKLSLTGFEGLIERFTFSPNGQNLVVTTNNCSIYFFDVISGKKLINNKKATIKHQYGYNSISYSPDGLYVLTAPIEIFKSNSGKIQCIEKDYSQEKARFSPLGNYIFCANYQNDWHIMNAATEMNKTYLKEVTFIPEIDLTNRYFLNFSPDDRKILTTPRDFYMDNKNEYYLMSNSTSHWSEEQRMVGHNGEVISATYSPNQKFIISTSEDETLIFWDAKTGKPIYRRIQLKDNNWLLLLWNSPYYMCSKDASKQLYYVTSDLKVIGFDQLDPIYNRPDVVFDSIEKHTGNINPDLKKHYREAWVKRIQKLGLDETKIGNGEFLIPSAMISNSEIIERENISGSVEISIQANDPKYSLMRFNLFINEVPLYGSKGISIAALNTQNWDSTITVPLSVGDNKIQVSVMNELGLESFKYPTYINYIPKEELIAKTYYIGIGVNEFAEPSHNLQYCISDVRDLSKELAKNKNVDTILLLNEQVTVENILKLKNILQKTTVNDRVIIACSSHGLLDENNNFYLAMYNTDFRMPKLNGLPYRELENLLDSIPARKKLLLIDACNSGENETQAETKLNANDQNTHPINPEERGAKISLSGKSNKKSSFETMMQLFVNVQNQTGSIIISASGGKQSALEAIEVNGKKIKNGAFTYSILEFFSNNSLSPEKLTVSQLKQYVEKRVVEITDGKQQPTSRQESMEVDWGIIK